jgi:hypothetical protein
VHFVGVSGGGGAKKSGPQEGSEGIDWLSLQARWVGAGEDGERFWRLTLREVENILKGLVQRQTRYHNEIAWAAWHTAALQRSKKLPKLKSLMLTGDVAPKRRQTVEEQIAIAVQWTNKLTKH